jgi:hypothetical protein
MSNEDDISEDDLQEYEQILIQFGQISDLFSSINLKNKYDAQSSYQALHITTLVLRDLLIKMHGVNSKDIDGLEDRVQNILDRNREQLRKKGQWT